MSISAKGPWRHESSEIPDSATPEMMTLPEGEFMMGAAAWEGANQASVNPDYSSEFPHMVLIGHSFAIGVCPVTFEAWDAARLSGADLHDPSDEGWGREARPVVNVSWEDARRFISWLNEVSGLTNKGDPYRLPSETEWEYACRAGTDTPFSFGNTISTNTANYNGGQIFGEGDKGVYREMTVPVGSFAANAFGLKDMHGNVAEWCEDAWAIGGCASYDESAVQKGDRNQHSPEKFCVERVLKGGSWTDHPRDIRSAHSEDGFHSFRCALNGFRLARTIVN